MREEVEEWQWKEREWSGAGEKVAAHERKKEKAATLSGDSSASTRHYVAAGTNLYKRKRKTPRKVKIEFKKDRKIT